MKTLFAVLLICSAAACKSKEPAKTESASKTEPAAPAATADPAAAPTPPSGSTKDAVDICGKIAAEEVEAVFAKLDGAPTAGKPQGSLLGECTWASAKGMASVSARPVDELDATVRVAKDAKEVPGIGEKAFASKLGYLVKPAGKPFMLQVMVMGLNGLDTAQTEALAKLAVEKL